MTELEQIDYEIEINKLKIQNQQLQEKYDRLIISHAIEKAFIAAGGIDDLTLDINPLELAIDFIGNRAKIEDGKLIFINRSGQRESTNLGEKIAQLKRGMPTLFDLQKTATNSISSTSSIG
jgi:hypothetical protein